MLDIKWIRQNPTQLDEILGRRGLPSLSQEILAKDQEVLALLKGVEAQKCRQNEVAKKVPKSSGEEKSQLIQEGIALKESLALEEHSLREARQRLHSFLETLPNLLEEDVPFGHGSEDNQVVKEKLFKREPERKSVPHDEFGTEMGWLDFPSAGEMSGARFVIMKGELARLERALIQWLFDCHQKAGYQEASVPYLVLEKSLWHTAQLPKFARDLFQTTGDHWLIPTGEVPLTNLMAKRVVSFQDLPLKVCALTPCFRSEAGSAGKDTRGMVRQHQFNKVELVNFVTKSEERQALEAMVDHVSSLLEALELSFRVVELCSGDLGFSARKTYDIEVWMAGEERWLEVSSCSLCGDFQSRRMESRYKGPQGEREWVRTLNGSALPTGRLLACLLEVYQREGGLEIPKVLQSYMGQTLIKGK